MTTALFLWLNVIAVFSTLVFCVFLKNFANDAYISGILFIAISIFSALPFTINFLILRKITLANRKIKSVTLFILFVLLFINILCLRIMYMDQFNFSRGFGLLLSVAIYLFIFLPLWITFLSQCKSEKRSSAEHK